MRQADAHGRCCGDAIDIEPVERRKRYVRFLARTLGDCRRLVRSTAFLTTLALSAANLLAGLAVGLKEVEPASRFVLEIVYANFAFFAAVVMVAAAMLPARRTAVAIAARLAILMGVVGGCLGFAAAMGVGFQLWHGEAPDWSLYLAGLALNLGWRLFHLVALVLFAQTLLGRWLGAAAAAALFAGTNLSFDHLLVAYGASVVPWSALDGFGPFLYWHLAAGIYWSAVSVLLLAAAFAVAVPRQRWRQRLAGNVGTIGWAAFVTVAVCAGWIHFNLYATPHFRVGDIPDDVRKDRPRQGEYSRLSFTIDIFPSERRLNVQARTIVVNRADSAIADLHLAFPPWLRVDEVALTGDLVEQSRWYRRYRLNRPLAPTEPLLVEYAGEWQAAPLPARTSRIPLLANGTFLVSTDLVPTLGQRFAPAETFASEGEVVFRAVVSAPLDQTVIAPGALARAWREENRAYFEYRTAAAIPALFSIHAGRYIRRRTRSADGLAIDIYCPSAEPDHVSANPRLEDGPTPADPPLRLVVFPDFRPLLQGVGLFHLGWRPPDIAAAEFDHLARAGVWSYSERRLWSRCSDSAGVTPSC